MSKRAKTAWFVTKGSYSDYQVLCAAATRKDAEAIVAEYNRRMPGGGDGPQVESVPIYTAADVTPKQHIMLYVERATGEVKDYNTTSLVWPWDYEYHGDFAVNTSARATITYSGTDTERVRKAASDRGAQIRAELEGL